MLYHKLQTHFRTLFLVLFFCLLGFAGITLYDAVPDELYLVAGEEEKMDFSVPVSFERKEESIAVLKNQTKKQKENLGEREYTLCCKFLNLIPVKDVSVHVVERTSVFPSGMPIGIYTKTMGVLVIGTGKVTAADGMIYEPSDQLISRGDYIVTVNGAEIQEKEELIDLVQQSKGEDLVLGIMREDDLIELKVRPVKAEDETYKLGIWVRDDMAGVGTLTYVKDLEYGALGHPVSDADTGSMISLAKGQIYQTDIVGIVKGEDGVPGELTGVINYNDQYVLGNILENTKTGIYGKMDEKFTEMEQESMETGMKQEIEKGDACILSSLDGTLKQYQIEIDEIDYNNKEKNKGILFHVTDEELLEKTGGIVQGMSGSPIIQNHRVIGAVTHVFISDATKGYGIFIETMLEH